MSIYRESRGKRKSACCFYQDILASLACYSIVSKMKADEVLYDKNQTTRFVYLIESGAVLVWDLSCPLHVAAPGTLIGLEALQGPKHYKYEAKTLWGSRIHRIESTIFKAQLTDSSEMLTWVLKEGERLQEQLYLSLALAYSGTVEQQVAYFLYRLTVCHSQNQLQESKTIPMKLTQAALARYLRTKRETVGRALAALRAKGLVVGSYGRLRIVDGLQLKALFSSVQRR